MTAKTIRLPVQLAEVLHQEAERKGMTMHDLIMFILWNGLKNIVQL